MSQYMTVGVRQQSELECIHGRLPCVASQCSVGENGW